MNRIFISFILMYQNEIYSLNVYVLGCGWQMAVIGFLLSVFLNRVKCKTFTLKYPWLGKDRTC